MNHTDQSAPYKEVPTDDSLVATAREHSQGSSTVHQPPFGRRIATVVAVLSVGLCLSLALVMGWNKKGNMNDLGKIVGFNSADEAARSNKILNVSRDDLIRADMERFEKGNGYPSLFYRGCVDFVKQFGGGKAFITGLPQLISQCKRGIFSSAQDKPVSEDANLLKAECDRMKEQIELQAFLLGNKSFATPDSACAVIVDVVLPIDEEPPCMRYVEDITHRTLRNPMTNAESWPGIMTSPYFKESFLHVCLHEAALDLEAEGKGAPGQVESSACQSTLEKLLSLDVVRYGNLAALFAEICPVLGMPTDFLSDQDGEDATVPTPTSRGSMASLMTKAAKMSSRRLNQSAALQERSRRTTRARQLSAKRVLDNALAEKGGSHRRLWSWSSMQSICCEETAYSHEAGSSLELGVSIGASAGVAYGFKKWAGSTCVYEKLYTTSVCAVADLTPGFSAEAVATGHGWWNNIDSVPGDSVAYTFGGHIFWAFGGGYSFISSGTVWKPWNFIGRVVEWSFAKIDCDLDSVATACWGGLDASRAGCRTSVTSKRTHKLRNVKNKCPGSACFPGDAVVTTPVGNKLMQDLVVSDQVLAADGNGRLFFDDVYFFGHADVDSVTPYMVLGLVSPRKFDCQQTQESPEEKLEISADHFMPICAAPMEVCGWRQRMYVYARELHIGSYVWIVEQNATGFANQSSMMRLTRVKSLKSVDKKGMYNPYTLSGSIVVNNVVASAHSSWVLDQWMPNSVVRHLPDIYQAMFFPGRVLYSMVGEVGADVLGMNNPQQSPDKKHPQQSPDTVGRRPFFLAMCFVAFGSLHAPKTLMRQAPLPKLERL